VAFEFETPQELAARLRLGREEFCQRLLTSLILEAPYPPWNTRSRPSGAGVAFLGELYGLGFGEEWGPADAVFVDELELPTRSDLEKGGAPDWAVFWPGHAWLIELKTESASHRADQIPYYCEASRGPHRSPVTCPDCPSMRPLLCTG
jgi:hypothetical protein